MVFTAVHLSTPSKFVLACVPFPLAKDLPPGAHSSYMTIRTCRRLFPVTPRLDVLDKNDSFQGS
ncbi:hypothetical protein K469DRAFT_702368 [Zopfia rhizophila CBS 207.26]|uniref:Uncharacterized protein n=1 Tax=Zopfia rhizophila CBS 207.26 TaxID=1314779 RepID=A0A6A6D7F4_9PEZI|nr:hypothetical protein K469DRAFT_702368 [Zopfia rhizophila CBS 207.26]